MKYLSRALGVLCIGVMLLSAGIATAAPDLKIGNYTLISNVRVSRIDYNYTYQVNVINNGTDAQNVTASLTSTASATTVVDGSLTFSDVAAGETKTSDNTFTIRQNRTVAFDASALAWDIQFEQIVGSEGGTIEGEGGTAVIIPQGATAEPIAVAIVPVPEEEIGADVPDGFTLMGAVSLDIGDAELTDNADISIPCPAGVPENAEIYVAEVVEYAGQNMFNMIDTAVVEGGNIVSQDPAFPGILYSGTYCFFLGQNVGWIGGQVTRSGQAVPGAVVTLSGGYWLDIADASGNYDLPAWAGNFVVVAFDPITGDHGEKQGYMSWSGQSVMVDVGIGGSSGPIQNTIVNGDFETGNLSGWVLIGAGNVVSSFGAISPYEGNYMARITTGSGAVGEASSAIEQTFTVPAGATTLTVHYNFVSEEYPEWVGSAYNDVFNASLYTPSGSIEVAFESVNTADFHPAPGLSSWGETGWLTATVNVEQWAGSNETLTFSVHDVGDTVVDTVALIDGVAFDTDNDDHVDCPCNTATQIVPNSSSIMGNIEVELDQDWFMFEAEAGVHYTIETIGGFGVPYDGDTYIVLSDGTSTIQTDDNSGLFQLSKIEWDCEVGGAYYVGVMGNQSSPSYTGNYFVNVSSKKLIYLGLLGAANSLEVIWGDEYYRDIIPGELYLNYYDANNENNINTLGNNSNGVEGIGLKLSQLSPSGLFRIAKPGALTYLETWIDDNFESNDHVVLAGHSAGGGDVQEIPYDLKPLNVNVLLTAQMDSIELWGDAEISENVAYAVNYYQDECFPSGENNIFAENSSQTTIIGNFHVINPIGPYLPLDEGNARHRNIDNDPRVWKSGELKTDGTYNYKGILQYINDYTFLSGL